MKKLFVSLVAFATGLMTAAKAAVQKVAAPVATAVAAAIAAPMALAQSTDPATGLAAIAEVQAGAVGYGPPMFGLAVLAVGIMIGVKWIKRARGAA